MGSVLYIHVNHTLVSLIGFDLRPHACARMSLVKIVVLPCPRGIAAKSNFKSVVT